MNNLASYVDKAKESLYFSGAKIDQHLEAFLKDQSAECLQLGAESRDSANHLFLVGSGGSFASMSTAKYIVDGLLPIGSDALPSYELLWRRPMKLDENSVTILASYSGETEDAVAALRFANERGSKTVAIVGKRESTMAKEASVTIPYDSGAIFEVPVAAIVLLAAGFTSGSSSEGDADALVTGLNELPAVMKQSLAEAENTAEDQARDLLSAQHLYVLGAGANAPLAYKVAMSVVMENVRIGATYSDACEWRHGPAEALERMRGRFLVLQGTDESREMTQRTVEFCRSQGSDVLILDAAEMGPIHPLLTPLVLNSHSQWLVVYSAILRGITDLDERVFMGRNVLAQGGAGWP